MKPNDARKILTEWLAKLRPLTYEELVAKVDSVLTEEIARDSHRTWQLEFQVVWDDEPGGNVRVLGTIDDGGLQAFVPLTDSFVKSPTGEFVGE
jgi:hypothetical protein